MTESSDDLLWHKRVIASQSTERLINTIRWFESQDFNKLTGSGIMISATQITCEKNPLEEFMVDGELLESLKPLICDSVRETLRMRVALMNSDIRKIQQEL